MRIIDHLSGSRPGPHRVRTCDPATALPGWGLNSVAEVQARPGERYLRESHLHHTVECVVEGRGLVEVGGERRVCLAGDSYWLPHGEPHLIEADHESPWRKIYGVVRGSLLLDLRAAYGLTTHIFPGCSIAAHLRRLLEHRGNDRSLHLQTGHVLHDIVGAWHASVQTDPDWPELVVLAKEFIDRSLEDAIRLREIAKQVGCSQSHLVRTFSRHVGSPPAAYLLRRRMDLAATLLVTTAEPIRSIADRLRYSDAFAFSHAFTQVMGQSPRQWRKGQTGR